MNQLVMPIGKMVRTKGLFNPVGSLMFAGRTDQFFSIAVIMNSVGASSFNLYFPLETKEIVLGDTTYVVDEITTKYIKLCPSLKPN